MSAIETLLRKDRSSFFLPTPYTTAELIDVSQRFAKRGDLDTAARFLSATGTISNEEALVYLGQGADETVDDGIVNKYKKKKKGMMKRRKVQRRRRSVRIMLEMLSLRTLRNGKILRT